MGHPKSSVTPKTLRELLVSEKMLTSDQALQVSQFMLDCDINCGTAVMFLNWVTADDISRLLKRMYSIEQVELNETQIHPMVKSLIRPERARKFQVFPIHVIEESGEKVLLIAMTDPLDGLAVAKMESESRMKVHSLFISLEHLQRLYLKFYRHALDIYPPEITSFKKDVAKKRLAMVSIKGEWSSEDKLRALIKLLLKKHIISETELTKELEKCS